MPHGPRRFKPPADMPIDRAKFYWHNLKELYKAENKLKHGKIIFWENDLAPGLLDIKRLLIREGYVSGVSGKNSLTDRGNRFCRVCKNFFGLEEYEVSES